MKCFRCGTTMEMSTVSETKRRGCFTMLIYLFLLIVPIIGWIALFSILKGSSKIKGVTYAVCPRCGHRKKV